MARDEVGSEQRGPGNLLPGLEKRWMNAARTACGFAIIILKVGSKLPTPTLQHPAFKSAPFCGLFQNRGTRGVHDIADVFVAHGPLRKVRFSIAPKNGPGTRPGSSRRCESYRHVAVSAERHRFARQFAYPRGDLRLQPDQGEHVHEGRLVGVVGAEANVHAEDRPAALIGDPAPDALQAGGIVAGAVFQTFQVMACARRVCDVSASF